VRAAAGRGQAQDYVIYECYRWRRRESASFLNDRGRARDAPLRVRCLTAYRALPWWWCCRRTTEQVSRVLAYCPEEGIKVVPSGGRGLALGRERCRRDGVLSAMAQVHRSARSISTTAWGSRSRRDQSRGDAGGRRCGRLLRARSSRRSLHHRRQCGGEFRRRQA